jgi:nucleoside 2-deoxyribosyltransferase
LKSVKKPGLYVASPLGFTEAGRIHNAQVVVPTLAAAGFEVLDPWSLDPGVIEAFASADAMAPGPERHAAFVDVNERIGRKNAEAIERSDALLAVLDEPDPDSGTASEIGYAYGLGRLIVGLRTDLRTSGDNDAAIVNLQVEWFIKASGGTVVRALDDAIRELHDRLQTRGAT